MLFRWIALVVEIFIKSPQLHIAEGFLCRFQLDNGIIWNCGIFEDNNNSITNIKSF